MCRGDFFLKNNKHADPNKAVQGEIYLKTFEHTFSEIFWRIYQKTFGHTFSEIFWRIYQKTFGHTFSENFWAYIFGNILKNLSENFWAALRAAQNFSEIRIFSKTILLTFLPNRYRYFTPGRVQSRLDILRIFQHVVDLSRPPDQPQ